MRKKGYEHAGRVLNTGTGGKRGRGRIRIETD